MDPRVAAVSDIPALVRLINAAYVVEQFFIRGQRTSATDIAEKLAADGGTFLVVDAAQPGEMAGAVYVMIHGGRGHIAMLSVDPASQKRGIGKALVTAVEERCRDAGCRGVDLDVVNLREELPPFYLALGFVRGGVLPFPDPGKLTRDAHLVRMTKSLR